MTHTAHMSRQSRIDIKALENLYYKELLKNNINNHMNTFASISDGSRYKFSLSGVFSQPDPPRNALAKLAQLESHRRKTVKCILLKKGIDVIDTYHGEMSFGPDFYAISSLKNAFQEILNESQNVYIEHNKDQPLEIQEVARNKLFRRIQNPGIQDIDGVHIEPKDIIIQPYSSTLLMINALQARPKKDRHIILSPEGFYKSNAALAFAAGLDVMTLPVDYEHDGIMVPEYLDRYLNQYGDRIALLMLTMPGNPLISIYDKEKLEQIARVIVKHDVDVLIDSLFDRREL